MSLLPILNSLHRRVTSLELQRLGAPVLEPWYICGREYDINEHYDVICDFHLFTQNDHLICVFGHEQKPYRINPETWDFIENKLQRGYESGTFSVSPEWKLKFKGSELFLVDEKDHSYQVVAILLKTKI